MQKVDGRRAVIVGAGPAGLAVGACLRARDVPFVLLEREAHLGSSWRRHYDRLHLHTHKRNSGLPGRPWPEAAPHYPSRDDVVAYLEAYAAAFELRPRLSEPAQRARYGGEAWHVETERRRYVAEHLVVATGLNERPYRPVWPGLGDLPKDLPLALPNAPGLHFCGFVVTAGGTLARIAREAEVIGASIAQGG